mgnify:CR=1 FL=1
MKPTLTIFAVLLLAPLAALYAAKIGAKQPEIAAKLRTAYAQWWKDVEPWTTQRSASIVGGDHEKPSTLVPSTQYRQTGLSPEKVLKGTYLDDQGKEICGAYYVSVRRLD